MDKLRQGLESSLHALATDYVDPYSLHVNAKKTEGRSNHPDREQQFDYIAVQRARFAGAGVAIISVDTKHKPLVGEFKNAGLT